MALMCGGGGGEQIDPELAKINAEAKKMMARVNEAEKKVTKMLLLGAGESGKSTIFKQMKIINKGGYSEKEAKEFIAIVHANTIVSMITLMEAFPRVGHEMPGDLAADFKQFQDLDGGKEQLTPELAALTKKMWENAETQKVYARKSEYQLNDSADYYFNDVERISAAGYHPTDQDILRSRVRTTGIVQSDFKIKSTQFHMFDVGGQRNERRKWIHAFDNVDVVIFVAALSEYDQVLFEDETMNRMDEAITLFDQIVNSKWFKETAMILFLNKRDLFEIKLKKKPLKKYYKVGDTSDDKLAGIADDTDMTACAEYFKERFLQKSKIKDKSIFTHITCATDTTNVKFVFDAVIAAVLESNLKGQGLM